MSLDLLSLTLKGFGFDPVGLMEQARQLGAVFEQLARAQQATLDRLDRIEANQQAIMASLGLDVPFPAGDVAVLIAIESARFMTVPAPV